MSKDKHDQDTPDMLEELELVDYLTDLMERMKDQDTVRIPDTVTTDDEFVQWVRGYN